MLGLVIVAFAIAGLCLLSLVVCVVKMQEMRDKMDEMGTRLLVVEGTVLAETRQENMAAVGLGELRLGRN